MLDITNPRQTIIVTLRHNKDSMFASDWHSPTSLNPFMYLVVLHKDSYSLEMIKQSHVFCVNFIGSNMVSYVLDIAETSTEFSEKFKDTGLKKEECSTIDCPRLENCLAYLECELKHIYDMGDSVIIIGTVTNSELLKVSKRLFHSSKGHFTTTE